MIALLREGPADGAACDVPDPPPATLCVEVCAEYVEDTAQPVAPGTEFPVIEYEGHGYTFTNRVLTEAGKEPQTRIVTAHYVYDESVNPESAGHTVVVEPNK